MKGLITGMICENLDVSEKWALQSRISFPELWHVCNSSQMRCISWHKCYFCLQAFPNDWMFCRGQNNLAHRRMRAKQDLNHLLEYIGYTPSWRMFTELVKAICTLLHVNKTCTFTKHVAPSEHMCWIFSQSGLFVPSFEDFPLFPMIFVFFVFVLFFLSDDDKVCPLDPTENLITNPLPDHVM